MNLPKWSLLAVVAAAAAPPAAAQNPQPPLGAPGRTFNPDPFRTNPLLSPVQVVPVNPLAPNPYFQNPLQNNPYTALVRNPLSAAAAAPYAPVVVSQPATAVQQPGGLVKRGPDLFVNPLSGTAVMPRAGVAQTADGALYYQIGRDGLPVAVFGGRGTGVYYNPVQGTYLSPATGVIAQPGVTSVFVPRLP